MDREKNFGALSLVLGALNSLTTISIAGLIAGILDLTAACVYSWIRAGVTPMRVFHSVASGVLGPNAFTGGTSAAALGIVLHFVIATTAAAVYYFASRKIRFLNEQSFAAGLIYGVLVYLFMNFVVLPLSAVARRPVPLSGRIYNALIIMCFVGLPIALIVRRFSRYRSLQLASSLPQRSPDAS